MDKDELIICLTGGSTGGHLFPLIFVTREMRKIMAAKNISIRFIYIGCRPVDANIFLKEGIEVYFIPSFKLRRYFSLSNLIDILKMPLSFLLAFYYLFKFLPNVIFSKGGPGSLAVVIMGWFLRLPIFIHDSDTIPGLTNKISSLFAKKIFISFPEAAEHLFHKKRTVLVGHPVNVETIVRPVLTEDYEKFKLNPEKKIIFVLGGSQGSKFLNDLILEILPSLLSLAQVVHQVGSQNFNEVKLQLAGLATITQEKKQININDYHLFSFISNDDTLRLLKMADLVISRAGAGSIFELAATGTPSILIPIEEAVAGKHQLLNAQKYYLAGACIMFEEKNAKPHVLLTEIVNILSNKELADKMREKAKAFAKLDAGFKIATELIDEILKQ
ncbi:MAG: UDP-N-acetylglucosamine--N-acetylmuramyl-(pentapeptide) pyrophosphoryl-undecaprenol N-acetylglucosamine transferase [Candidatus Parcubacteria bacterium]|nr:MAG: UDP-N-acetylglucosamine--N-acetylmuramyl-(pentapeptide) pyrophosphoryl-undecaprenol N-acetylglucosamine transferase [Candidatus Parcubacteria bacterium]